MNAKPKKINKYILQRSRMYLMASEIETLASRESSMPVLSGSLTVNIKSPIKTPGSPTIIKAICHGFISPKSGRIIDSEFTTYPTTAPPIIKARPPPTIAPDLYAPMALPSLSSVK